MSVVNDLICRARQHPKPAELTINDSQVGTIVEDFIARRYDPKKGPSRAELAALIRSGNLRFMAIPLRVLGASAPSAADTLGAHTSST